MRIIFSLILVLAVSVPCVAQEEKLVEKYLDNYDAGFSEDYGNIFEDLNDLLSNPLLFNSMSRSDMAAIPFLTESQIALILSFRDSVRADLKWDDVFSLISASEDQREILPKLILLDDSVVRDKRYRKPVKILFIDGWWRNLEKARGFDSDNGPAEFAGPQYGLRSRIQVSGRDFNIKAIAESDPGEADFRRPDHLSAGIEVNPERGPFKLLLGDYNYSAGQGLGFATRPVFSSWKADPHMQIKRGRGFGLHGSSDENRYLRGGAFSYEEGNFTGRVFFSSRDIDATMKENGEKYIGERYTEDWYNGGWRLGGYMSGIYSAGLHRTATEIAKKDAVYEEVSGISLEYRGMKVELGGLLARFNYSENFRLVMPDAWPEPEPQYRDKARRYSLYGRGLLGRGLLAGELAISSTGGYALASAFSAFYRNGLAYSIIYEAIGAGFFSHYTSVSSSIIKSDGYNRGRINILYQPRKKWKIIIETGLSSNMQPALTPGSGEIYLKSCFYYDNGPALVEGAVQFKPDRVITAWKIKQNSTLRPINWQAETGFSSEKLNALFKNPGTYFSARVRYQAPSERLGIQAGLSFFTGTETSLPFYLYEPDVYYGMSLPALSGVGARSFLLVRYNIIKSLYLEAKISRVDYDDRIEIGTGNDMIDSNHRTVVKVQVVYRSNYEL